MNTLTKIFVVVNLVLSVAFVAVAATVLSQRAHWRQKYNDTKATLEADVSDLQGKNEQLEKKVRATIKSQQEAEGDAEVVRQRLESEQDKTQELAKDKKQLQLDKENANRRARENKTALEGCRKNLETARGEIRAKEKAIAEQKEKVRQRENANHQLLVRIGQFKLTQQGLRDQIADLTEDVKRFQRYREFVRLHFPEADRAALGTAGGAEIPVRIHATVGDVDMKNKLVVLTVGSKTDPAVREGYTFLIHRSGKFLARVKITAVYDKMSAAEIVEPSTEQPIQIGDSAIFTF